MIEIIGDIETEEDYKYEDDYERWREFYFNKLESGLEALFNSLMSEGYFKNDKNKFEREAIMIINSLCR